MNSKIRNTDGLLFTWSQAKFLIESGILEPMQLVVLDMENFKTLLHPSSKAVLLNDGETLEEICKNGWENYLKHRDELKGLMDSDGS